MSLILLLTAEGTAVPLIVEDGSGVPGADSYAAVLAATDYWSARPHDPNAAKWAAAAATVGKQEGALREATAYLDATWGPLYIGARKTAEQGRLWPRVDRSGCEDKPLIGADKLPVADLPVELITAAIELAARALSKRLAQDKGEEGWLKRRKTGPLEREWGGPGVAGGSFGAIDGILAPILTAPRNPALASSAPQWNWR